MGFLSDIAGVAQIAGIATGNPILAAGGSLLGGIAGGNAASDAAAAQAAGQQAAISEQRRQFDLTRQDLAPYLQAGTNALSQYQNVMGQAPGIPTLSPFTGQAVQAPNLQQFTGGPALQSFQFDPSQIANSPAYQFQLQQGQQQIDRLAGKNRLLNSGARLQAAQQFGQGLASQALQDEFNRQLAANQAQNAAISGNFNQGLATNQAINAMLGQQYGLNTQQLGQQQNLYNQEQNRLLSQYGLSQDAFNQRLNRLAGLIDIGRGTGTTLGSLGANAASNVSQLLAAQGATQGAGILGQSNALNQGLQNAAGLYGYFNPPTYNPGTNYNSIYGIGASSTPSTYSTGVQF